MKLKQNITIGQSLKMSTTMQQYIKMLQVPVYEIDSWINNELLQNPLLDYDYNNNTEKLNVNNHPNHHGSMNHIISYNNHSGSNGTDGLQNIAQEVTLRQHITEQIYLDITNAQDRIIAFHLLDEIDDNGYLSKEYIKITEVLNCDEVRINLVLEKLQKMDPCGVFARDISECLTLQLKEQNIYDKNFKIILNNLDLLAKHNIELLGKKTNLDLNDLKDKIAIIRNLNPKPGNMFASTPVKYKTPDIYVYKKEDKQLRVELNSDNLPKLLVNKTYYYDLKKNSKNILDKEKIVEFYNSANGFINALEQRANTILKVASAIVAKQELFFEHGIISIKPMTLAEIASETGLNESTISRVTASKFMDTPYGVYAMKYFFSKAIESQGGREGISNRKVKELIRNIIEQEEHSLSDEDIAIELSKFKIKIARRTVTKYREFLQIPSSSVRKRKKVLE